MKSTILATAALSLLSIGGTPAAPSADITQAVRATHKLFNQSSTATCFLIHKDDAPEQPLIVTSAHVFEKMKGDHALLVLRKKGDGGRFERLDFKVPISKDGKALWSKHGKHDIAVLALPSRPEGVPCPSLPLSLVADEKALIATGLTVSDRVFVLTYPERFEANKAGFPIARGATIASFPLTPIEHHPSFIADFTAFGGDSGAPVLLPRKKGLPPLVVGICIAQFRHDEKIAGLGEERTVHHPLGLGKVLHAQFIRETIALLDTPAS